MKSTSTLVASVFVLVVSGSALLACNSESPTDSTPEEPTALTGQEISGNWVTQGCEAYPNGQGGENYLTRDFTLTDKEWDLKLVIFGDKECTFPLFESNIHGPYSLGALSEKVEGATEGTFGLDKNDWTALDKSMVDVFSQSGCGTGTWEVGTPQDVTGTGCIGVAHKEAECPEEYDVVSLDGDSLFFGERITDMCKKEGRPAALGAFPVYKK